MKLKRQRKFHAEVATASLNDIMFFLLLFFLIVSTLANPNVIKLMLPSASTSQQVQKQPITVSITKDKAYFINRTPIAPPLLEAKLTELIANVPDASVVLRADNAITIQDLVDVMSICARLKVKIVIATELAK